MIRSGSRKIFRDIASRKTRTFLVSASIFIGVLGVIALFTTSDLIRHQLEEDVRQDELTMIDVTVSIDRSVQPNNAQYLATLNQQNTEGQAIPALDGISVVEGWAYYSIDFRLPDASEFETGELRAYSVPLSELQLEPTRLLEGDFPGTGQVALEKRMAEKHGFETGDEITFRVSGDEGITEVTYTVSGLVFHPYSTRGLAGELPGPDIGIYTELDDAQSLLGFTGFSQFVARYESFELAEQNFEGFVASISEISPYVPVVPAIEDPAKNFQVENSKIFTDIINSLALTTMVVSGFLVINVVNTITAEQRQQIGVLKALGVGTGENFTIYSGIALTYGVLGALPAIIPGLVVGNLITGYLAPRIDVVIEGFGWSPRAVLLGVFLGLVVPVLAAAIPVYNGARISILQAITDLGITAGNYGTGPIARIIGALPLPVTIRQAISNVYQKRWRLALTGITLIVTIATFMGTAALTISVTTEIARLFDRLGYEVIVAPNEVQDFESMRATLEAIDGVGGVSPATIVFIQMPGDYVNFFTGDNQVQVFGLDPAAGMLDFRYQDGTGWRDDPTRDGMVISTSVARQLDVEAGDSIDFFVSGKPQSTEIIGIDAGAFDAINMRWDEIAGYAGLVGGGPLPNEYILPVSLARDPNLEITALGMDEPLLTLLAADFDAADEHVIISGDLAANASIDEDDTLNLMVGGINAEREVVAVVPNALLEANATQDVPENMILFAFNDLVTITGEDSGGDPVPNAYYITLDADNPTTEDADDIIDTIQESLLEQGINARFINQLKQADLATEQTVSNTSIFLIAALLIAVVGAIGLLTTLSISVFERQKEIGVMRSIGAGSSVIALQFLIEGLIVGLVAWLVGLPISYGVALAFNAVANLEHVTFTYPRIVPLIGLVGMLVVASLASLGPSLSAARKTVSEILRYQ